MPVLSGAMLSTKVATMMFTFLVGLFGCALPDFIKRRLSRHAAQLLDGFMSLSNSFAAGAFLALGLFHLLPEATKQLEASGWVLRGHNFGWSLPLVGYYFILFVEHVMFSGRSNSPRSCGGNGGSLFVYEFEESEEMLEPSRSNPEDEKSRLQPIQGWRSYRAAEIIGGMGGFRASSQLSEEYDQFGPRRMDAAEFLLDTNGEVDTIDEQPAFSVAVAASHAAPAPCWISVDEDAEEEEGGGRPVKKEHKSARAFALSQNAVMGDMRQVLSQGFNSRATSLFQSRRQEARDVKYFSSEESSSEGSSDECFSDDSSSSGEDNRYDLHFTDVCSVGVPESRLDSDKRVWNTAAYQRARTQAHVASGNCRHRGNQPLLVKEGSAEGGMNVRRKERLIEDLSIDRRQQRESGQRGKRMAVLRRSSTDHINRPTWLSVTWASIGKAVGGIDSSAIFLCLSLSVHSLFEGIVIGTTGGIADTWTITGIVCGHKWAAAFALASSFLKSKASRPYLVVFVLSSPIGVLAGMAAPEDSVLGGVFNSLGAGTCLFIANEILLDELRPAKHEQLMQWLRLGFVLIGALLGWGLTISHYLTAGGHDH
eukprot:GHVS01037474.1.p1 GENE.GHVS01037474.1~~GHVS01037474.1.p1  ORF type:complete len:595 (-),score=50.77 GHVS01037474.1:169-1953(-)